MLQAMGRLNLPISLQVGASDSNIFSNEQERVAHPNKQVFWGTCKLCAST